MKRVFGIIGFIIFLNVSCNNNTKQKDVLENIEEETIQKQLTINFNFKTNKKDVFKIMLNNIIVDELQSKNIHIYEDVLPSTSFDAIEAKFDTNNISNTIVFSLGNEEVKEVEIKNILVTYGNNQVDIKSPDDLNKYIRFNKFIERDSSSNTLNTKRVDGKLNPSFRIKNNLINLLKKE